jgi:hypothetical protein
MYRFASSTALALLLSLVPTNLYADHDAGSKKAPHSMPEPSKDQRAKMAEMHEQMATCLRSDKPMADCHKQMMENCPMGKDGSCSMMGMKHHEHDHEGKEK